MWFMRMIDYFVGDLFREDTDRFQKARLLVGAILTFLASIIGFGPFYVLISNLHGMASMAFFIIALPAIGFWIYLLRLLKSGRGYLFTSHSVVASAAAVLFSRIAVTGGPVGTEVHPLLMIAVMFAFLLIGKRGGIIWTGTIALIYFVMVAMNYAGVAFINLPPEEARGDTAKDGDQATGHHDRGIKRDC